MFDRLFNIIRANLGDMLQKDTEITDEEWEIYRKEQEKKRQQQQAPYSSYIQPSREEMDYYAILELKQGASFEEIKASYRQLIKKYHPDKFYNDKEKYNVALEITQKLNKAYSYFEKKFGK